MSRQGQLPNVDWKPGATPGKDKKEKKMTKKGTVDDVSASDSPVVPSDPDEKLIFEVHQLASSAVSHKVSVDRSPPAELSPFTHPPVGNLVAFVVVVVVMVRTGLRMKLINTRAEFGKSYTFIRDIAEIAITEFLAERLAPLPCALSIHMLLHKRYVS